MSSPTRLYSYLPCRNLRIPSSGEIAYGSNTTESSNTDGDYEIWFAAADFSSRRPIDPAIVTQTFLDRKPPPGRPRLLVG